MTSKQTVEQHTNGYGNGNGNGNGKHNAATQMKDFNTVWEPKAQSLAQPLPFRPDDQPIILERPSWWSHAFMWMIVSMTGAGLLWAALAPLDQSVPAVGKLEAESAAKELRAPNGGVVREVLVKDGDRVKKGQTLLILDTVAPQADLTALLKQKEMLTQENDFYKAILNGQIVSSNISGGSPELQQLLKSKAALIGENQYYQALVNGSDGVSKPSGDEFYANQQQLLTASRSEYKSRVEAARLQIEELKTQLNQANTQLASAQQQIPMYQQQINSASEKLAAAQRQYETAKLQLPNARERVETGKKLLATDEALLKKIEPALKAGAISDLQGQRQAQQILVRQNELSSSEGEVLSREEQLSTISGEIASRQGEISQRKTELMKTEAEVKRLQEEQNRLNVDINRASQQWENAIALSKKDVRTRIADNHKQIAQLDSQLARLQLDNQKKLSDINSQISKAQQAVQFQTIEAPVDGLVFNLKPTGPGYVVRQIDAEPVMSIVPDDKLVAKVYLTNRDIGQVVDKLTKEKDGLKVEVNVESFPSTEFGTLEGKLTSTSLGSDVLPPTQERPYYSFPAKIQLTNQTLKINGKEFRVQSGMAVNASIKVRKRTVLSIFTELFQKQVDNLETVR